ncbi:MAG: thiamine pyrophosphate-binding protein [Chloroflexi bacterium]|nr:thiamine pyrophosphate-binding protein [Chloroflexota bacterium]
MMKRDRCLELLARYRTEEIVVTAWQATNEWLVFSPSERNFAAVRTMGEASTFALGLAIARPDLRVIVLEGDGSLLMNLTSLVTIAEFGPPNFYQFILQNRVYELTGGQSLPNIDHLDFATIARGCGLKHVHSFGEFADYERELPRLLASEGPLFAVLDVEPGKYHISSPDWGKRVRAIDRDGVRTLKRLLQ